MLIIIGIGNGLHADGTPSKMSDAVVETCRQIANKPSIRYKMLAAAKNGIRIIFSGGYKVNGVTEADSMNNLYWTKPAYNGSASGAVPTIIENASYRTHNNAFEALRAATLCLHCDGGEQNAIAIVDHPLHIKRTELSFLTVNRLYYGGKLKMFGVSSDGPYDKDVPGQPYWATEESFASYEKRRMQLYRFLLRKPWACIGFRALRMIWPSNKQ